MRTFLVVENGIVVNSVVADESFANSQGWLEPKQGAGIGWLFDGVDFTPPLIPEEPIPESVTMRQARLALHAVGKLTAVQDAINLLTEPPKTEAQIEWDYASVVERSSPFVSMLTPALGMTEEEMDELFRVASKL